MQPSTGSGSVSRMALEIEVVGKESVNCELVRHLAPTTARLLLNSLPIRGRAHRYGEQFVYFETGLIVGSEKQKTQFKRGEMALLVSNGSVCVFLKDTAGQAMNPLGRVTENIEAIESTGPGDVMELRRPATTA